MSDTTCPSVPTMFKKLIPLAIKIETATQANHRRVHAVSSSSACATWRGCLNPLSAKLVVFVNRVFVKNTILSRSKAWAFAIFSRFCQNFPFPSLALQPCIESGYCIVQISVPFFVHLSVCRRSSSLFGFPCSNCMASQCGILSGIARFPSSVTSSWRGNSVQVGVHILTG